MFSGLEKYIMSRRFIRLPMLFVLLLSSQVWAIGLGDIQLDSALNEPLRAEIVLLSASPDELSDLKVALASSETFARYGIDRPFFLQGVEFNVVNRGTSGSVVQIRSRAPITEPFLTFLVEATWSSGRLLREYTVLLDPPTYAPPATQQAPAVSAPVRTTPSDSGRIDRQPEPTTTPAPQQTRPAPRPSQSSPSTTQSADPKPRPPVDDAPYASNNAGELVIQRGDTLWGVASRMRPDSRLTMNQTMLAIFEANPDAFGGNINVLRAGARLRVPSADEIFQISRGDALSEVQRQHSAWSGGSYVAPQQATQPGLVLVPPDDEPAGSDYDDSATYEPMSREDEIENRIAELESADVPNQQSLIEIRDNELATLRQELANIRGEVYEPPVDDTVTEDVADDAIVDDGDAALDDVFVDEIDAADAGQDDAVDDTATTDDAAADADAPPANVIRSSRSRDQGIVDQAIEFLTGFWGIIIGALLLVVGGLIWFMRRGDDDDDDARPWERLDDDELATGAMTATGSLSSTETMEAPTPDEAIVVVEQDSGVHRTIDDTVETPVADATPEDSSGSFGSLEDTFSSETAVNLDQTDPIAEADFHMAYGLYDQAADLVNGALESDPSDKSLMSKLCEIYFVWGNRDAFVDAASKLKATVGDSDSAEWDKIVIMGQQIAADHEMFAGAGVLGATKAVDLAFDDGGDDGALDMDFGADSGGDASDVIDLGGDDGDDALDFGFDEAADGEIDFDVTAESPTLEVTAEMPEPTVESPTLEQPFAGHDDGTSELPALDETLQDAIAGSGLDSEATAEINLDDLDLGGSELDDLDITGTNEALVDVAAETGRNPEIDPNATGIQERLDPNATGLVEGLDLSDLDDTGMRLAPDETGQNPMVTAEEESTDFDIDENLLDATGRTQVLSEDMVVDTATGMVNEIGDSDATQMAGTLADDAETLLASLDDDDDFDFAKTEALPPEAFTGNTDLDDTTEAKAIAETDVDLDLDDLTAALQVSEIGDTVEQPRDDATVEQPRPSMSDDTAEVPTMNLAPEDMSSDLHEARTMTEVGTKLDLARAYVDMGDPAGARSILEEVLDEGDDGQKQQAQQLLDSLPS